jgi:hypothetical protein
MAVPTTGNFLMFGTGSNTTIAGAIIEGGASSETVASTLNFNALKSLADINKFDVEFKEGATTLEQIVKSTQFRGYPIFKCNFNGLTIICDSITTTTTISPCGFNGLTIICDSITTTTTTTTEAPTTTTTAAPTTTTTTATPTTTTTAAPTIFTHGAVRAVCSDYCTTNYNITTLTLADANYDSLTIGDTIYGQGGVAGFVAYSNVSTDTTTGPFRIAEIDSSGVVVSIKVCVGGSCEVL